MNPKLTADLGLNTDEFANKSKAAFSGLGKGIEDAGKDLPAKFNAALDPGLRAAERKIRDTLKKAMTATPDGQILNLDLPGLRAGALAAEAKAKAARDLASAMAAVQTASQGVTRAQQVELAAANAVATKYEQQARAAVAEVQALEQLQAELGQTAVAHEAAAEASNAHRAGLQNVGFQFQDFFVQVAGGTSAIRAASQQLPQLVGALQMMSLSATDSQSKFTRFTRFLGSGFGIALGVAIPIVGMLAEKLLSSGDAATKAEDASRKLADGIDFQKLSTNELIKSINELEKAQRKQIETSRDAEAQSLRSATTSLQEATARRQTAIATLQALKASQRSSFAEMTGGLGGDSAQFASHLAASGVDREIAALEAAESAAARLVRMRQVPIVRGQAEARADPRKGITERYERDQSRLSQEYAAGKISLDQYQASQDKLTAARERDIEALKKQSDAGGKAAREARRLSESGEDAAKKIANITDRFSETPSQVVAINKAMRELDDIANDFALKKPPNYQELLGQLEQAREIIGNSLAGPLNNALKSATEDATRASQEAIRLAEIRSTMGEAAAQNAEAELGVMRQFPGLEGRRAGQLAIYQGVSVRVTDTMLEQLATLRRLAVEEAERQRRAESLARILGDVQTLSNMHVGNFFADNDNEMFQLAGEFEDLFSGGVSAIWSRFLREGQATIADVAAEFALAQISIGQRDALKLIAGNAGMGAAAAGMMGGNGVGGALGGVAGGELGKVLGATVKEGAKGLGAVLGGIAGPLGSVLGGVLGGVVGNLFRKAPSAGTVVTSVDGKSQVTGNNSNAQAAVSGISVNLQSSLQRIIDQLGGMAGSFAVSIGKYKDDYRVKSDGSPTAGNKHPGDANLIYNGPDATEALRIAILDAIKDGAVQGISGTIRNIITANQDIDLGLSKATRLQAAFREFKALTDPVGAAMDDLNLKFRQLNEIAKEGGASASELENLRQLYQMQKAEALKAANASADGLRSFLQSLKAGDTSPLSLRDQERNAAAALEPFRQAILAGQSVDNEAFQKAAQTSLSIAQQINGSTDAFFQQYDLITSLTEKAIAQIDASAKSPEENDPFGAAIAKTNQAIANMTEQQSAQLDKQTELLRQLADAAANNNSSAFLAATRGY